MASTATQGRCKTGRIYLHIQNGQILNFWQLPYQRAFTDWTNGMLFRVKLHFDRCTVSSLRYQTPQIRPKFEILRAFIPTTCHRLAGNFTCNSVSMVYTSTQFHLRQCIPLCLLDFECLGLPH